MNGIENGGFSSMEMEYIRRHHSQSAGENQCSSTLVKHIRAPVPLVNDVFCDQFSFSAFDFVVSFFFSQFLIC